MKNTKTIAKVLTLIIIISLIYIGFSNYSTITLSRRVSETVVYMKENNAYKTFELLNSFSLEEKEEIINWIKKNPDEIAPFFYMYFADEIFKKNKDEAVLWFFIGRLRATEDVQMCKDKTASAQVDIYPNLAPNTITYLVKIKDKDYRLKTLEKAVEWDEKHSKRVSPVWACFHGMEAFSHYPELLPMSEYKKIQKQTRQNVLKSIKK